MKCHRLHATALAASLLVAAMSASAADKAVESSSTPAMAQPQLDIAEAAAKKALDALGIQLWGYMRSGAYTAKDSAQRGKYAISEIGYYRLGNEGDTYFEFGIGKKWDLTGAKVGTYWMPFAYSAINGQGGSNGTKQIYADISGLGFAPELTFWAGQRYHRIQDVHIIDDWLMEDGDNFGAGVDNIKLGSMGGTLNIAVYTEGQTGGGPDTSHGKRLNVQLRDLVVNPGGKLNLTAGFVRGSFADKKNSFALGLLHNQTIGVLTNSLFVQGSNGHADLRGKFYNLNSTTTTTTQTVDTTVTPTNPGPIFPVITTTTTSTTSNPGAKQFRIIDAINWQSGPLGGQAMIGYQTLNPEDTHTKVKDLSLGGRISYGVAKNIKLYGEGAYTTRKIDGQETQHLNKETIAVALAPNTDFWSRPELRLYLTHTNWNSAAQAANNFNANGKTNALLVGAQVEAWW